MLSSLLGLYLILRYYLTVEIATLKHGFSNSVFFDRKRKIVWGQGNLVNLDNFKRTRSIMSLKEVIQPHLPIRLPCYDFIPVISLTFDASLLAVESAASGKTNSHDVTGGVYKTRERIHGVIADTPLLAIPTSCSRVADYNPNWDQV